MGPSFKVRIQCLLTGAFIILSPLSVATEFPLMEPAKYVRLALTIAIVGIGIIAGDFRRMGIGSQGLLAFSFVFVTAGIWSTAPEWALLNKGMFALTCFSGVAVALSLRNLNDLRWGLRFLGIVAGAAAITVFLVYIKNPTNSASQDRMAFMGINPNAIGHSTVPLSVLALYVAQNDRSRIVKLLMLGACGVMTLIIIATGCRGALLTLLLGIGCLMLPSIRNPGILLALALGGFTAYYIGFEVLRIGGSDRVVNEMVKDTRFGVWAWAFKSFAKSPLIGCGWMHFGSHGAYCQSMYIQVLAESGLLGGFTLLVAMCGIAQSWFRCNARVRQSVFLKRVGYLSLAFIGLELFHGVFESTPFTATSVASLALGFGIGLAENLPRISRTAGGGQPAVTGLQGGVNVRRRPTAKEVLESMGANRRTNSTSSAARLSEIENSVGDSL